MAQPRDSVGWLLDQAGRIPLLTHDEEIILGRQVQAMQVLLRNRPEGPYTKADSNVIRLGKRAKERFIGANLRLVVSISKRYLMRVKHLEMADLIQEGVIGLIRGVEKYDPERGYKFSTYAYWWIRQAMNRALDHSERAIRLPCNAISALGKIGDWMPSFVEQHGRPPTPDECAEHCGVGIDTMRHYLNYTRRTSSLDALMTTSGGDEGNALLDKLSSYDKNVLHQIDSESQAAVLENLLHNIPEAERLVLAKRHGLLGETIQTQKEIQAETGLHRNTLRDMEKRGIARLQRMAQSPYAYEGVSA